MTQEYIKKATLTESLDKFKVDSPRILHAVIGVNTEVGELLLATNETNWIEEIGDVLWYIAVLADEIEASFDELNLLGQMEEADVSMVSLFSYANSALDLIKRGLFYGVELDQLGLARCIGVVLHLLKTMLEQEELTLEMAMDANIAKLTRRYGDKFTTEAAVHRDVEAEIEELKRQIQ